MKDKIKNTRTIALLTNNDDDVFCFRKELIEALIADGFQMLISCPDGPKFELMKEIPYIYDNPDIDTFLQNALTDNQKKYIKVFYCQGGFNYEKMKAPSRLAMKMFVSTLKNKKDATEKEKGMAEKMASSYDISDIKFIEPIVAYLEGIDNEKAI